MAIHTLDLPETVEIPTDAILEAAAKFYALGELIFIVSGEPDVEGVFTGCEALLMAAGLVETTDDYRTAFDELVGERAKALLDVMMRSELGQLKLGDPAISPEAA